MNRIITSISMVLSLILADPLCARDEHEHEHDQVEESDHRTVEVQHNNEIDNEHDEENSIQLSVEQRQAAGIVVEALTRQPIAIHIEAPGEIVLNSYETRQVTPRIEAQVIARHAKLGDKVSVGQPLVSLSSVAMSEAQGVMLTADNEWRRVRSLGGKVIAERLSQDARIAVQQARARLLAYGMTAVQIDKLVRGDSIDQADGSFDLLAPIDGTVIHDDFIGGQMVQPGNLLFEISDESRVWVEARLDPGSVHDVKTGSVAQIMADGHLIQGEVILVHHTLDETTRTLAVRLVIPNPDDKLHPGQFVNVRINSGNTGENGILVPQAAVLRSPDGDWQVFLEHEPDEFKPREVEVIRQLGNQILIDGIKPGTRVVTQGAFFVQSELAKSGFAVHNH